MKSAMKHLASNMSSVIDTEEWESFTKQHPDLVTEVMRVIVDKRGGARGRMKMMNKTVFLLCSVKPTLLLLIHKCCFVFLDKIHLFQGLHLPRYLG